MDEALLSIWASLYSWFSPTVLFVLLNLVIGTIAVTSKVGGRGGGAEEGGADHPDDHRKLARTPSAIFGRLRSFKISRQPTFEMDTATTETLGADHPDDRRKLARTPSAIFGRLRSFKLSRQPTFEMDTATTETITHHESASPPPSLDVAEQEQQHHFIRSQSDAQPTAGEMPPKLPAKLKKSASTKSAFGHFEVKDIVQAPEEEEEEEVKEVDAKADAFITRFRQQLQLQRLDSLLRYKEMLHRGR